MKNLFAIIGFSVGLVASRPHELSQEQPLAIQNTLLGFDQVSWTSYKTKFGLVFGKAEQEIASFEHFIMNVKEINHHNSKNLSYELGINQFTHLNQTEFQEYIQHGFNKKLLQMHAQVQTKDNSIPIYQNSNVSTLPKSLDWRDKNVVTIVKDQGQCGSCWSFSATGAIESCSAIQGNVLIDLSEQELVDCATGFPYFNKGCKGGSMDSAFKYVQKYGLCTATDYPYTAIDGSCTQTCKSYVKSISSYVDVKSGDENSLLNAIQFGPVSVAIEADQYQFQSYKSGVLDFDCGTDLDHGVLLVGYGTDSSTGTDYWLVKNSWGTSWGENGYVKIARGSDSCGIADMASYPTM